MEEQHARVLDASYRQLLLAGRRSRARFCIWFRLHRCDHAIQQFRGLVGLCARKVQPGQLFVAGPNGPCHVICRPPRGLDVDRVAMAARSTEC